MQVRFHPLYPEILASGSLDHEVRIWDAHTADCIGSRNFCNFSDQSLPKYVDMFFPSWSSDCAYMVSWVHHVSDRPIASIAFHAQGELLAVASGHKVRCSEIKEQRQ